MTTVTLTVAAGTQQWTPPADCTTIDRIELWGPGGSGGHRSGRTTGGGAGAYNRIEGPITVASLLVAGTIPYQTGLGGAQLPALGAGNPGTAKTWFSAIGTYAADFGLGGLNTGASGATAGGAGGLVANCVPTTNAVAGGNGGSDSSGAGASGGGASGSINGAGVDAVAVTTAIGGAGGVAPSGGGNGGAGAVNLTAVDGSSPGGGGGGLNSGTVTTIHSGGGANGQIIITYTPAVTGHAITGVAGTSGVGTVSKEVDKASTGVGATGNAGTTLVDISGPIVVVLTTTSASPQTWIVPSDAPVGTVLYVEAWGAGSGGSGGSASFESGGAGGAWAKSKYKVTPNDVANGISYTLQAGSAGTAAANSTVGPDTNFSTNNLNLFTNSVMNGAVVGTPGTLPTGWSIQQGTVALSTSVVGFGTEPTTGFQYIDVRFFGTTATTGNPTIAIDYPLAATGVPASTTCTFSTYVSMVGGSTANLAVGNVGNVQWEYGNPGFQAFISGGNIASLTATATQISCSGATGIGTTTVDGQITINPTGAGVAIDITLRVQAVQFESGASATFWKSTPGYTLAKGGGVTSGTTGGVGGATATSVGSITKNAGGSGATHAAGGGGGGAAGKDGAGTSATTATGGTGDAGSGGAAGVSNVEGGGGSTAATSPATAGAPGGGGGANTATGSGATGGRGQVRVTYTGTSYGPRTKPWRQRHMLIR